MCQRLTRFFCVLVVQAQVSKERERELDTYLQDKKKEGEPSVDDLIEPKDALSDQ